MAHDDSASFRPRALPRQSTIRSFMLPAMLAFSAVLSAPQARASAAPTTTSLAVTSAGSDVTSVASGTVVTLTATVVSGSTPVSPGQVKFCDAAAAHCEDSALLATAQLTPAGTATYKFRPGIGSHSYQAVFVGSKSFVTSTSTAADLTVTLAGKYPTTTTITSSGSIGNYALTATVTGAAGIPLSLTGDVSFRDTSNANASLGMAKLGTATSTENFVTASMPAVGLYPYSIVTADFNGDGILDLATANNTDNTVTVLLGNGDGTFTLKSSPSVGSTPVSITEGDFNGDGIPDLAVTNSGDNTVTVLLGNGDGSFAAKSTPTVGKGPDSIAAGDFNGDGILDLAVANGAGNTVSVLLGNGDGTFALKSSPAVGNDPTSVAIADFNGDGIPDLATSNNTDSTVTVLLGKGDGTFTLKSSPGTGNNPTAIAVGDFNGDGIPDLVTAETTYTTDDLLTVLLGKGDGTFTTAQQIYGSAADCVAVSDLNGDGIPDLITSQGSPAMTIFLGNGDGTFTFMSNPPVFGYPTSIAVGDFNGDGTPDLAATVKVYAPSLVSVDLNQFTQTATATLSNVSVSGVETHPVEASYAGNTGFSGSVSSTVPLLAAKINTSLTLTSNTSTSIAGNPITLTATLSPYIQGPFTTDAETVTFYNGGTSIGTGTLSAGVATLNISSLHSGTHTLTATYSGDQNFSGSTSGSVTVTISPIVTMLQLYSSSNPSMQGAPVTLSALLSPDYSNGLSADSETVTFYNGGTVLGTAAISENAGGVASLTVASLPNGIDKLTASYAGDGVFASATSNTVPQAVGVAFPPIPNFVVTVKTDATAGVASNCTSTPAPNCSLRDALAAAFAAGSGNITFDPAVFATPQTIAGGQSIPPHTTIIGPTTGAGATLKNLVTVSGGGPVFTVNPGVTNAAISGLTITEGGGIVNSGVLVVSDSTISGNSGGGYPVASGGGIENFGTLTLINSTVTGNSVSVSGNAQGTVAQGGGIDNQGTLTITNSSVVGNSLLGYLFGGAANVGLIGGGINNQGTLTMTDSVVAGNSANANAQGNPLWYAVISGGGIANFGTMTLTNSIVSANTDNGSEDDCDGSGCPANGVNGNIVGPNAQLAPFGNYGGPTQTLPPLPGSPAICAGVVADIPSGVTTDQRGFPRTTTYGSNPPYVDSGSVQTNYALAFSTQPPAIVAPNANFTAAVQLSESGNAFPVSGVTIPLALGAGSTGSLTGGSAATSATGVAPYSSLQINAAGYGDTLVATLPLTASGITPVATASAKSSAFDVTLSANIQVTIGTSPAGLSFMVDGVSYSAPAMLTWITGSQHTLAVTSPQDISGTQYTFAAWSDGGAISHTVGASTATTDYTATFDLNGYLLTIFANPPQGGVVSPASGTFYPSNAVVNLTATPNPGYLFTGWTGNVASASNTSTTITMSAPETVTANFELPTYIVTTNLDDGTGTAANCTTPGQSCSLRDALLAAAVAGAGITFDPTVFAATQPFSARTITLGSAGTLNIPSNTTITGPTTGSGATYTQLVTVNGNNQTTDFTVSAANVVVSGLIITGGNNAYASQGGGGILNNNGATLTILNTSVSGNSAGQGGGIFNGGTLTVTNSVISGNTAYNYGTPGGGIENDGGTLSINSSTISGNTASGYGGAIDSFMGSVTIIDSTISGNTAGGLSIAGSVDGQGNPLFGVLTISDSTVTGNTGDYGIDLGVTVTLTMTNSIAAGNPGSSNSSDCGGFNAYSCPTNGVGGNLVGVSPLLAALGNYGGFTQTMPPLPGSPAICAGVASGLPATDQRGRPRTTTYGSNPPCVDSGTVQTNYALAFSAEPPSTVQLDTNFTAAVQLSESGNPFPVSGVPVPMALGAGSTGSLSGGSAATGSTGVATYSSLKVNMEGSGDTLVATLSLTTTPPPAPLTSTINISATSSAFSVGIESQTITFTAPASPVTYGVSPIALSATATSGLPVTFSVISGPGTVIASTLTITGVGTIVVEANQAGNADYTAAAQVTQTIIVNKATPSLSLMVTPATPTYGTLLTFTGAPAPAGTSSTDFSFVVDKGTANSTIVPATVTANATVTATYGQLKAGAHSVELDFSGTPNYAAATSPSVPVNIAQATPTFTWSPVSSIPYGTNASALLNATANIPGSFNYSAQQAGGTSIPLAPSTLLPADSYTVTASFTPTDTVDYKSATQTSALIVSEKMLTVTANNATRVYGTANPVFTGTVTGAVNGDTFTEAFTTTATMASDAGTYAIVPGLTGPNLADYAVTMKNGTLTITQAASTTTLTSSTSNADLNASVTFTATVISSTSGTPGGAVQFLNGSTVLGMSPLNSQGVAAYSTTELFAGSNAINAVYAGDQNFTGSMAELMQQVTAPAFSLKSSASQLSLIGGDTGQLTITLTPFGGYTGMTSLSCAGLPQNATCSFNPPTLTANGSNSPVTTTMTITTHGPGSGTVGLLRPQSPGTSALLASLAGLPACLAGLILFWQRRRLSLPVRRPFCAILLIGGLAGFVALSACGGSSQPKTPPGTSTVSVMATGSGNTSQSITITLTVTQ